MRWLLCLLLFGLSYAQTPDTDGDGYPDVVEIRSSAERAIFMDWFATVAEAQYTAISPAWDEAIQDCSGLLRFAFVEALREKNLEWFDNYPYFPERPIPPLTSVSYPLPVLSRSVFRNAPGAFQWNDMMEGRLVGMATAYELMRYSSIPLGRSAERARRGDLLFFVHPLAEGSGYHSMIYLGNGMIVYHTGLTPAEGGEVRLLSLATLRRHPDPTWHPVANNPHFLGFYRWKILD